MTYQYGKSSRKVLWELSPRLRQVAERGLEILSDRHGPDVRLTDGLRTPQEASANAKAGVGVVNSKHLPDATGKARAFDFVPLSFSDPWPRKTDAPDVRRAKLECFKEAIGAFLEAADELGVVVRTGADWDVDGIWTDEDPTEKKNIPDYPHIELLASGDLRYSVAVDARLRRIAARLRGERWPI